MKVGEDAVAILLDLLNELKIEYMVVGSFSSNRYGVPRATKDADLVLKIVASEREKLFSRLPPTFEIDSQVTFEMITGTWSADYRNPEHSFHHRTFRTKRRPPRPKPLLPQANSNPSLPPSIHPNRRGCDHTETPLESGRKSFQRLR